MSRELDLFFLAPKLVRPLPIHTTIAQYLPSRSLRSPDACLLAVPWCKTVHGSRAFRIARPTVLTRFIGTSDPVTVFRRFVAL